MDLPTGMERPSAGLLGYCVVCSQPLPLRTPPPHEQGYDWMCIGCGAVYYGALVENSRARILENVRAAAPDSAEQRDLSDPSDVPAHFSKARSSGAPTPQRRRPSWSGTPADWPEEAESVGAAGRYLGHWQPDVWADWDRVSVGQWASVSADRALRSLRPSNQQDMVPREASFLHPREGIRRGRGLRQIGQRRRERNRRTLKRQ